MRSQCYDGAANMAGKSKGVGPRIQRLYPKALPFWCTAHQLNRCVVMACGMPTVRNMMGAADQVVLFFENSPKKQNVLEQNIESCHTDRRTKLKQLCKTRWVERHDAFAVLVDLLPAVVKALDVFAKQPNTRTPGAPDAQSLVNSICTFEFLICLIVVQSCLGFVKGLSKSLQERELDISRALQHVTVVEGALKTAREEVESFHSKCYDKAVGLAATLDVDIRKPRTCGRQSHRDNVPSDSVSDFFCKALTIPFLDHLCNEMSARFTDLHSRAAMGMHLVPSLMTSVPGVDDLTFFKEDLPSPDTIEHELRMWYSIWEKKDVRPSTIQEALNSCDTIFYPNIVTILKICATFPVTSCECERSISALRLLKSYLRSTMSQDRLSSLALAFIHRSVAVDVKKVIKEFARRQPRRILLPNILFESKD